MSIRTKFTLILLAFIIVPIVMFSVMVYSTARNSLMDVRIAQLNNVAALKKDRIEAFFNAWRSEISMAQHNPDIEQYLPLLVANAGSKESAAYRHAFAELEEQLRVIQVVNGYLNVLLTDAKGNIVFSGSDRGHGPRSGVLSPVKYFHEAQKNIFFSDIYRRSSEAAPLAMIGAAPVHDSLGVFVGEIVIEQGMDLIYRTILDTTGLGRTGEVVISRREGDTVMFLSPLKDDPQAAFAKKIPYDSKQAYPSQRASRGETGSGVALDYQDNEVLAAWQYLPSLRWGLVTKIDSSEAFAPVVRLRNMIVLLGSIILFLAVLVAYATARSVTDPILDLQKGTAVIGSGDLDHGVGTTAKDEVGNLSRLIDTMTANLKKVTASRDVLDAEIAVRKQAEQSLVEQSRVLEAYFKHSVSPLVFLDREFNFLRVNEAYARVCSRSVDDFSGHNHFVDYPSDELKQKFQKVVNTGIPYYVDARPFLFPDHPEWGVTYWDLIVNPILDADGTVDVLVFSLNDVTHRTETEQRIAVTNALLKQFAGKFDRKEYLDAAVDLISEWSGCRNVGIRIRDEKGNIPFRSYRGFSDEFLASENALSLAIDRCTCTRVITGDPELQERPGMTTSGSFATNDLRAFMEELKPDERTAFRGACRKCGFGSLAVIPVKHRDHMLGAIHLADERKGMVPLKNVEFLEQLAFIIGEAVYRFDIEDELRRNYDALRVSETRYRTLVEDVRDVIFTLTERGSIASLNAAFEASTGLSRDEYVGRQFSELIHPDDLPHATGFFAGILSGHMMPLFELRVRTRSEVYRIFEFKVATDRTADGMILGTARDVTERKQAEDQLKFFVDLINQSIDAVYVAEPETSSIVEFNDAACLSTGYSREDLLSMKVTDLSHKQFDSARWNDHVAEVRKKGSMLIEDVVYRKDGSDFPVEVSVKYIVHGQRDFLVAVIRDVTERKQAEEERARLVSAVESAADAIVITGPTTGAIQYVNRAFEQVTGYTRQEVLGRTLHFLESGKDDRELFRRIRESLAQDGVWSGKLVNKRKDGSPYFEECTVWPVKNRNNEIINYVYIKRDVTERLRLESLAESVNTMDNIGYVFSGVRHEIGNPINSLNMILGILRAKLDTLPPESVKDYLAKMTEQVSRVEYILRSLKSFNLYETQEPQNIDLSHFMANFLPLIKDDLAQKGISVKAAVEPGSTAYADPRALQQVLLNIITNAADAVSGRTGPVIALSLSRSAGSAQIRVRDNGQGIPRDKLKDIFRPFYTTKKHGTGLGLVIVQKMLARMNGRIDLTSTMDEGTTAEITIPEGTHEVSKDKKNAARHRR
jgi:PAS domain S-box-containing protein